MRLAPLLHFSELCEVEFLIFDGAPIVLCVVHRETRSECSVGANDEPVLASAATPMLSYATHKSFHILQAWNGVHHLVPVTLLVDEPIEQIIHHPEIFGANVSVVFAQVLEVRLLHHRRFVDMEREGDAVV